MPTFIKTLNDLPPMLFGKTGVLFQEVDKAQCTPLFPPTKIHPVLGSIDGCLWRGCYGLGSDELKA